MIKLIFLHADKHESLLQIDAMILMGIVKHSQLASLQCLYNISNKEVRDEVYFLHADKHQSFLKVVSTFEHQSFLPGYVIITDGCDQAFSKYSK